MKLSICHAHFALHIHVTKFHGYVDTRWLKISYLMNAVVTVLFGDGI